MLQPQERTRFEQLVLPHLDGAANLARWLLRNRADAEDVVQEGMLRAYRFFDHFRGGDARLAVTDCAKQLLQLAGEESAVGIND